MILEGVTSGGAVVPVEVTAQGRLVAEGLTGPAGPPGPEGPEGPAGSGSQWVTSGADIYYSAGNVGVGSTSPVNKLDVNGSISASGAFSNTGYAPAVHIGLSSGNPTICSGNNVASAYLPLVFTRDTTTGSAESMRLDASGRLLVGTNSAPAGTAAGDVVTDAAFVVRSPNGTWWAIGVDDGGNLYAASTSVMAQRRNATGGGRRDRT